MSEHEMINRSTRQNLEYEEDSQASDEERDFTNDDSTTFMPTGEIEKLPTRIYKDNKLPTDTRQRLLQTFPRNTFIKFTPPPMDKELLKRMQKESKDTDKILQRVSYQTSSSLRPLDCAIKMLYQTKPNSENKQALEAWEYMELSLLSMCSLLLDSLSYISEQRQEQAIKCINPDHQTKTEVETLFADKLMELVIEDEASNQGQVIGVRAINTWGQVTGHVHKQIGTEMQIFIRAILQHSHTSRKDRGTTESVLYKVGRSNWRIMGIKNNKTGYEPVWIEPPLLKQQDLIQQNMSPQDRTKLDAENDYRNSSGCNLLHFKALFDTKANGESHPVIDLRELNSFVAHKHFKMKALFRFRFPQYTLCIYSIAFWANDKSSDIHKDTKTSNRNVESPGHHIDRLLRQHLNNGQVKKTSTRAYPKGLWETRIPGVHNKQEEITIRPIKNNGVFRLQHKLSRDDIHDTTKKGKGHPERMPEIKCNHRSNLSSKAVFESPAQGQELGDKTAGMKWTSMTFKRMQVGMRHSMEKTNSLWMIGRPAGSRPHKSVKINGSKESTREMGTYQESDSSGVKRQYDHSSIHQQAGRNSITSIEFTDRRNLDNLSVQTYRHDWMINKAVFNQIQQIWGPMDLDAFVNYKNYMTPAYISWKPDPKARIWANPPWILLPRVLNKVIREKLTIVIVFPRWPLAPWFPVLLSLLDDILRKLLNNPIVPGLSEKAIRLYEAAYDKGSTRTISSNIKKWISWCIEQKADPITCSLNNIIEFFNDQIEADREYNTIAGYRSAIIYNKNPPPPTDNEIVNLVPAFDKVPSDLTRIDASSMVLTAHGAMFSIKSPKEHKISLFHGGNKPASKKIYVGHYLELPEISPLAAVNALLMQTQN
ncbi:3236_t:CDS:10 [Cetraspora pellucida]|uniref:3236_t:CDS:1 n=1 Tax=Cetraspora pellucida TaxID=1433469 RepID=A0A9N9HXY5_9GLOM|nr:3236_t:CDS:10 [Cetraspora pellucida]